MPILIAQEAIECNTEDLLAWNCKVDYNALLGIKKNMDPDEANDPGLFVADLFLAATFFIGTIAFLWLVISWLQYVLQGGTDAKAASKAGEWIKYSLIGLTIVIFSYTIIRLIQYFAAGRV